MTTATKTTTRAPAPDDWAWRDAKKIGVCALHFTPALEIDWFVSILHGRGVIVWEKGVQFPIAPQVIVQALYAEYDRLEAAGELP